MIGRIPSSLLVLIICLFGFSAFSLNSDGILVSYSFDDDTMHTGPDTFAIFQNAKGTVSLTDLLSTSGYQSVEISDVAGDNDFPELQGYFPLLDEGTLYLHFSFLIANPDQEFNIALAGPKWFGLKKDGIAFWLSNKDGYLIHYSDSMPKKLFPIKSAYWYTFDLTYYIDQGIYDLTVMEEGNEHPVVELYSVKNAANQPGSAVDKFSFIGDLRDDVSNVVYYVDDIIIATTKDVFSRKFIAPGRRKLFIDLWNEQRQLSHGKLVCLPMTSLMDFGIPTSMRSEFKRQGAFGFVNSLFLNSNGDGDGIERFTSPVGDYLRGMHAWYQGCNALERNEAEKALALFQEASNAITNSRLIELSETMAHAALKSWDEVIYRLSFTYAEWDYDSRYDIALAMIYFSKGDTTLEYPFYNRGENDILYSENNQKVIDFLNRVLTTDAHTKLRKDMSADHYQGIEPYIVAEQQFVFLIWTLSYDRAYAYAETMLDHLNAYELPTSAWLERLGDAAFMLNDFPTAIGKYEQSLAANGRRVGAMSKLSDVYYLTGDLEKERIYREKIYGQLSKIPRQKWTPKTGQVVKV